MHSNADAGAVRVPSGGSSSLCSWTERLQGAGIRHVHMRTCVTGNRGVPFRSIEYKACILKEPRGVSRLREKYMQVEGTSWGIKEANSVKAVGGMSTEGPGVSDNGMPFTAAHQDDDIMPSDDSALWAEVVGLPSIQPQIMYVMKVKCLSSIDYDLYIHAVIVLHNRAVSCTICVVMKNGIGILYGVAFVIMLIRIP